MAPLVSAGGAFFLVSLRSGFQHKKLCVFASWCEKMGNEPITGKEKLIHSVQQSYGIEIANLAFMLRGFGGDCFRGETNDGHPYFLKLHDPVNNQMMAASSRAFYLPLMYQLYNRDILPDIPHPIPTLDGALSLKIDANELVITNFIAGELVGFGELPNSVLTQLAEQVGILHRSIADLEFKYPFEDHFEIVFEKELVQSFNTMAALPATATAGQILLRESILPHKDQVITYLIRLKELQSYAQTAGKAKVVCHTDLHGGNLITDEEGKLYILDWENALIAPPEHDLFFFVGEKGFWDLFWPNYIRQFSSASIDPDILRFYFYRRGLEDIADFIFRILRREDDPEKDRQEVKWMLECVTGLAEVEKTIKEIQSTLLT